VAQGEAVTEAQKKKLAIQTIALMLFSFSEADREDIIFAARAKKLTVDEIRDAIKRGSQLPQNYNDSLLDSVSSKKDS
jgi:hypothetical protein